MSVAWVAGSVRAQAMRRRRAGRGLLEVVAASHGLRQALDVLAAPPNRLGVGTDMTLVEAQRAVTESVVWNVRVLAGWLPRAGVKMLRLVCGPIEIANVEDRLREMAGGPAANPYRLGSLSTAWTRLSHATNPAEIATVLASSPWGDPGGDSVPELLLSMRTALVARAMLAPPALRRWTAGAGALLLARERFLGAGRLPDSAAENLSQAFGSAALGATTLADLRAGLPLDARWALDDVAAPEGLWRAEARWWSAVDEEGRRLSRGYSASPETVLGAAAALAADAWRLRAALSLAAHGGGRLEAYSALA